jgi:hypothetical protein
LNFSRHIRSINTGALLFLLSVQAWCQNDLLIQENHIGFTVGANVAFGTHFQRFGLNANFFYAKGQLQANTQLRAYMSFKNLGPQFIYPELVVSQGLVVAYGAKQSWFNPFLNSVSNQTGYSSSVAYSYNAYLNAKKTTQQTGLVALQFNAITFIAENDILARTYYDRFRTGAFLLQYQFEDKYQAALNCTLWTGKMGRTISDTAGGRWPCYMDTVRGIYPGYSHGLLSVQFRYNIGLAQNVQVNAGIDAEQVRDAMQNKLIHDLVFIPRRWVKPENCHMPMLDSEGNQYLYRPGQRIRPPKPYWNVFSNANVFY